VHRRFSSCLPLVALLAARLAFACGSTNPPPNDEGADATAPPDDGAVPPTDAPASGEGGADAAKTDGATDAAKPDAAIGPLTCTTPGAFATNWSGQCGTDRWAVKTGTDNGASSISLLPTVTTIAALSTPAQPVSLPFSTRVKPTEATIFALRDVRLSYLRLEQDSDYHLVVTDNFGANTMIVEVPYPADCTTGSAWQCQISRARAAVEAKFPGLVLNTGKPTNMVVTVAGVGFWDTEHGQFGASPDGIELHPLLAICFDQGCSLD
jgi:hypothetical protein